MKTVMNKQSTAIKTQVTMLASDGSIYIGTVPNQVTLSVDVNAEQRN